MSRLAFVSRRLAGLLVSVWVVFTLVFVYVAAVPFAGRTPDYGRVPATASDPLLSRYVDWLTWFLTVWDEPVTTTLFDHLGFTAVYLVPSLCFAVAVGTVVRVYTVGREDARLDVGVTAFTLVAVSVPVFVVALALRTTALSPFFQALGTVRIYDRSLGALHRRNLVAAVWPTASMALYLLAVQLLYAGEFLREHARSAFVKTARAKGATDWRVGRHLFRNTAVPLLTLFFTDMLGMVLVGVFAVEHVVGVPGLADLLITAVIGQDLPLVLSFAVVFVLLSVLANFFQDVVYALFDPRVEFEE